MTHVTSAVRSLGIFAIALAVPALAVAEDYSIAGANPYVAKKDWNGLLIYTRAWTQAKPNDPMAWYYMGQMYGAGLNQPNQALTAFRRAVALKQEWPEAWHAIAITAIQLKQYEEAVKAEHKALSQAPDRPNSWGTLAAAYSEMLQWKETLDTLHEEIHHMSKANSYDWYDLGNGLSNAGEYQEAVAAYARSIQMKADFGDVWNNLGIAQAVLGHDDAALQDYKRAAQLGDPLSAKNLSDLQRKVDAGKAALAQQAGMKGHGQGVYHCAPAVNVYGQMGASINHPICWWQ